MAIGRISGPLLKENLTRDGVNLRFEDDLLYLKVTDPNSANHRIGIKNSNPAYTLDITGTARASTLLGGELDIDEIYINDNTISSQIGDLILNAATNLDKVTINNDVLINGNLHATGSITADGSLQLGDANTDNVVFGADVNSDIMPNITDTYILGGTGKRWLNGNFKFLEIGELYLSNNTVTTSTTNSDLYLTGNGTGAVVINNSLTVGPNGAITMPGNITIGGTLTVTGDIIGGPLRTDDIQIVGNRIETTSSNSNFEINTVGTGSIELLANSNVTGTFEVSSLATLAQARVSDLTSGRLTYAGTSGRLQDSANLTFDGSTLTVVGNEVITGGVTVNQLTVNQYAEFTGQVIANNNVDIIGTLTVTGDIIGGPLVTDDIRIAGNRIETTSSNSNLELNTVGTGSIELQTNTNVTGTLAATNISSTGQVTFATGASGSVASFGTASNRVWINGGSANNTIYSENNQLQIAPGGLNWSTQGALFTTTNVDVKYTTTSTSPTTGALIVAGGAGIAENLNVGGTFDVNGLATLDNLQVNGTTTLTGPVTANNNVSIAGTLTVTGDIVGGPLRTDDIQIVGNRIETTASNSNFEINTVGTGTVELLANTNVTGTFDVSSQATLASANVEDLTSGRIVLAGTLGELEDSANLTFDGTTVSVTGNISVTGGTTSTINGITITGTTLDSTDSSGITFTPQVTFNSDASVENNLYVRNQITTENMIVEGNLTVLGTETVINSTTFSITDGLIYLGEDNQSDVIDLGFVGSYNDGTYQHTGLVRDATDGKWKLFESVVDEPELTINFNQATYGVLKLGTLEADSILNSNLTAGRIVLAGTSGELEDSVNLTFNGTTLTVTGDETVTGTATLGDLLVNRTTTFSGLVTANDNVSIAGNLIVTGDIIGGPLRTDDIQIVGNRIETTSSNSNFEIDTVGTGSIELLTNTNVTGTLDVSGQTTLASANVEDLTSGRVVLAGTSGELEDSANLTFDGTTLTVTGDQHITGDLDVDGDITLGGNIRIGNQDVDTVTVVADFTSDLFPNESNTYDIGRANKAWRTLYASEFDNNVININDNTIRTTVSNADLELVANGTGNIIVPSNDVTFSQNLDVTGTTTLNVTTINDTLTVNDTSTFNNTVDVNSTLTVTGAVVVNGNTTNTGDVSVSGNLTVTGDIIGGPLRTDDIQIVGNRIETTSSNSNFEIDTVGTGSIELLTNSRVTGTFDVTGKTTLGTTDGDTVDVKAEFISNLVPDTTDTYDLGIAGKRWNQLNTNNALIGDVSISGTTIETTVLNSDLYLNANGSGSVIISNLLTLGSSGSLSFSGETVNFNNILIDGDGDYSVIRTLDSNTNLYLDAAGTGTINLTSNTNIVGNLDVTGDITLGGNIRIGDTTLDTVTVQADFTSDLIPNASNLYDLGSSSKQWRTVNAAEFDNNIININDNVITTKVSNADLELRANGTGTILVPQNDVTFSQALTVNGNTTLDVTTVNDTLTVNAVSTFNNNVTVNGDATVTGNVDSATITTGQIDVDGIRIDTTVISTTESNADLVLDPSGSGIVYINGTGAVRIPAGNTFERPATGEAGFIRYNSQTNNIEAWNGVVFTGISGGSSADANGDTLITFETAGNNEDIIRFFTGIAGETPGSTLDSVERVTISNNGLTVDGNIRLQNNYIETTVSNSDLELRAHGTGQVYVPTNNVEIENDLTVNTATYLNTLDTSGQATLASANVEDLTAGRIVLAGTNGELEDSANLTFNGTLLTVTGNEEITGTLDVTGNTTLNYTEIDELLVSGKVRISGNVIENTVSDEDLIIRASGSGRVILDGAGGPGETGNVFATDPLLTLNSSQYGANTYDSGLIIERGSDINKAFIWDESADAFALVSTIEQGTVRGNVAITNYQDVHVASVKLTSESTNKVTFTDADKIIRTVDAGEVAYVDGVIKFTTSAEAAIPTGTTAERPAAPQEGTVRFNTTDLAFEGYAEGSWRSMGFGAGTAPTYQGFLADGIDFEFTLSQVPLSAAAIMVAINGVVQEPSIAYTVDGSILRFIDDTSTVVAPEANDRIDVRFLSMPAVTSVHTVNFTADGVSDTFDTQFQIPNEECIMVFVNSVYQDTEVYDINGTEVTFIDETPALDDRINIVIFPTIIAPDLPTKTYVDQQITLVSNTATDDAIAFAIALG